MTRKFRKSIIIIILVILALVIAYISLFVYYKYQYPGLDINQLNVFISSEKQTFSVQDKINLNIAIVNTQLFYQWPKKAGGIKCNIELQLDGKPIAQPAECANQPSVAEKLYPFSTANYSQEYSLPENLTGRHKLSIIWQAQQSNILDINIIK